MADVESRGAERHVRGEEEPAASKRERPSHGGESFPTAPDTRTEDYGVDAPTGQGRDPLRCIVANIDGPVGARLAELVPARA
jgi:hypothetical protein